MASTDERLKYDKQRNASGKVGKRSIPSTQAKPSFGMQPQRAPVGVAWMPRTTSANVKQPATQNAVAPTAAPAVSGTYPGGQQYVPSNATTLGVPSTSTMAPGQASAAGQNPENFVFWNDRGERHEVPHVRDVTGYWDENKQWVYFDDAVDRWNVLYTNYGASALPNYTGYTVEGYYNQLQPITYGGEGGGGGGGVGGGRGKGYANQSGIYWRI